MTTETIWRPDGNVVGLTDRPRLPRLGKIHLGIRKTSARGSEYPAATDFFVCPDVVKAVYGEKPRELDIVFPSDDVSRVAPVSWKSYTATRGKVCTGDGKRAIRLIDDEKLTAKPTQDDYDAAIVTADSKKVSWHEIVCPAKECVFAKRNLCKPVMNLMFLLPKVPGIGAYQLDTGSINSILDVRGGIELVMQLAGGRLAGIPLKLRLEPMEVISPEDQKKKLVWTLKLISPATLGKVLMAGERNLRELLMADEGPSRSVGLPELTDGREIPSPHEPEEDLFPHAVPNDSSLARQSGANDAAHAAQADRATEERVTAPTAPSAPKETDLQARAEELFAELNVPAKERQVFRNAHRGRAGDLVAFLEKQVEKRRK